METNLLYSFMQACCIEYIILESDNLSSLFPNAYLSFGGIELNSHLLFAILTTLAILPTVWLRDLRILSYISGNKVKHNIEFNWYPLSMYYCLEDNDNTLTFYSSLWSSRNDFSGSMLVMGWCGRRHSHAYKRNNNTQSWNFSCCYGTLWLLLCRTCCVPKPIYSHGKSKSIPCSAVDMVIQRQTLLFFYVYFCSDLNSEHCFPRYLSALAHMVIVTVLSLVKRHFGGLKMST